ncbi:hypothetical protein [Flavobacterium sp.]|uniref:hypothetical protein n=1 Tax=Flavobacterium sp. TaxID=239 RepID=UPI002ED972CD
MQSLSNLEGISINMNKDLLIDVLENSALNSTQQILHHFNKIVPHWFLSLWFSKEKGENDTDYKKRMYISSQTFENECMYALYDEER